jgi:hypothetical protein
MAGLRFWKHYRIDFISFGYRNKKHNNIFDFNYRIYSVHLVPELNKSEPEPKRVDAMRLQKTVTNVKLNLKYILITITITRTT